MLKSERVLITKSIEATPINHATCAHISIGHAQGLACSLVPRPLPMLHAEKRFQRATLKSWEWPVDEATSLYVRCSYDRSDKAVAV